MQVGSREAFIEMEEITVIPYADGTDGRRGKKLARAGEGVSLCTCRKAFSPHDRRGGGDMGTSTGGWAGVGVGA